MHLFVWLLKSKYNTHFMLNTCSQPSGIVQLWEHLLAGFLKPAIWNVTAHGDARQGGLKGEMANAVGSQYPSHYLGTWCIQHYYRWCAHLGCAVVDWTEAPPPPTDLNGFVRFAERRNVVSERVPSHFNWTLLTFWRSPAELCQNTAA